MLRDTVHFRMMSLVHETGYGLFRDPYPPLRAAGLCPGQTVLEVGCGPGFFTLPAAEIVGRAGSVTSVDVSPAAVAHVQRKLEAAKTPDVEVLLANASSISLPDESFDLAFVFGLGHVVGTLQDMWVELHRLLRAGGTLAIEGRLEPPGALFDLCQVNGRITRFVKAG
jgi:demethylmenaquinone methyltransferase/2-methoxy-6-polyprenyl-1,4-benzoquinol methylase